MQRVPECMRYANLCRRTSTSRGAAGRLQAHAQDAVNGVAVTHNSTHAARLQSRRPGGSLSFSLVRQPNGSVVLATKNRVCFRFTEARLRECLCVRHLVNLSGRPTETGSSRLDLQSDVKPCEASSAYLRARSVRDGACSLGSPDLCVVCLSLAGCAGSGDPQRRRALVMASR